MKGTINLTTLGKYLAVMSVLVLINLAGRFLIPPEMHGAYTLGSILGWASGVSFVIVYVQWLRP